LCLVKAQFILKLLVAMFNVGFEDSTRGRTWRQSQKDNTKCGDRTHDHTIKSRALYRLS
jgi:hypothetical protein